jgi:predicted CoA-substrate-specific enzyme activase
MNIETVIDPTRVAQIGTASVIGVDIGSRTAKAAFLHQGQLHVAQVATGVFMQETADELLEGLLDQANASRDEVDFIVGTGYGRVALRFTGIPTEIVTEISCHALGAHFLNAATRTIVDIGGQDSKVIQVDPATGKVVRFIMNDKCAAGTGRFLEKAAGLLDLTLAELGPASLRATKELTVSSQCVVFAESEIISLRARGETREDIAAGLHMASARRVKNILSRMPIEPDLMFTGGVSNNVGMRHALQTLAGHPIALPRLDTIYAGALGGAIFAQRYAAESRKVVALPRTGEAADLSDLPQRIAKAESAFIERRDVKKVGYLCNYVPVELLAASGLAATRLARCGDSEVVSRGELITKSVFCDFTKSLLGHFATKDPLHEALDRVYTFYTCDAMKATAEAVDNFFKPTRGYVVPRNNDRESARVFFRQEILNFRRDLETLAGRPISGDDVALRIRQYNRARTLVREISDLRKRRNPPLTGRDFLEVTRLFHVLPPEELIPLLQDIRARLAAVPDGSGGRLRLMMAGGVVADGDRRVLDLIEDEIGARVVVEDHCTGLSPFLHDTAEDGDPWRALADAYLDQAPCARQFPLERRIDVSAQLAREYRVDGVIYSYLKFCPCYGLTKNVFLRRFQSLGIPALELASDYSHGDIGQIRTRIEAFVEVLQEKLEEWNVA